MIQNGTAAPQCGKSNTRNNKPGNNNSGKSKLRNDNPPNDNSGNTQQDRCNPQTEKQNQNQPRENHLEEDLLREALYCDDFLSDNLFPEYFLPSRLTDKTKGWYTRGYIPHWDASHTIQHITYHLSDSLPQRWIHEIQAKSAMDGREDGKHGQRWRSCLEDYLDKGYGSCILREPEVAACIIDTWFHFHQIRYLLLEWVVMPNHCHILMESLESVPLDRIVLSWKNFTGRFIRQFAKYKMVPWGQKQSRVWQREYWDRYIRNEVHLAVVRDYIRGNPVKAGLVEHPEDWPWSSACGRGR